MGAPIRLTIPGDITIIEEQGGTLPEGALRFKGVALRDNIVSQKGRGRYYTPAFNDRCMARTNERIEAGVTPVRIYTRHGRAMPKKGELPQYLPVGKVERLWREGVDIMYQGLVLPTSEGKDAIMLIREGVEKPTSVRIGQFEGKPVQMNGRTVEEALDGILYGIDLAEEAGVEGAGVASILEELPEGDEEEETDDMDWSKVTLEDLKQNCEALLAEYTTDLVGRVEALTTENATLKGQVESNDTETLRTQMAEQAFELAKAKACLTGVSKKLFELVSAQVTTAEDIPAKVAELRAEAINSFIPVADEGTPKGKTRIKDEDDEDEEEEEQEGEETVCEEGLSLL